MILVTGAGSTIGTHLVNALHDAGSSFRAAYHSEDKAEAARCRGLDAVTMDFAQPDSLRAPLSGTQTLFLLSPTSPVLTRQEPAILQLARETGVTYVVKVSVWGADSGAFGFARWHHPVEQALKASGIAHVVLRPNGFMQNITRNMAATIREHNAFHMPGTSGAMSFIDARDIAHTAARVLTDRAHSGNTYTLSGPEALTWPQVAEILSHSLGREIRHVDQPMEAFRADALQAGAPEWLVDSLLELVAYDEAGHAAEVTPHVQRITGRPPTPFKKFVLDYLEEFGW